MNRLFGTRAFVLRAFVFGNFLAGMTASVWRCSPRKCRSAMFYSLTVTPPPHQCDSTMFYSLSGSNHLANATVLCSFAHCGAHHLANAAVRSFRTVTRSSVACALLNASRGIRKLSSYRPTDQQRQTDRQRCWQKSLFEQTRTEKHKTLGPPFHARSEAAFLKLCWQTSP